MKKSRSRKSKAAVIEPPVQLAVLNDEASLAKLRSQTGFFARAWEWLQSRPSSRSDSHRLRVADTVSLGEKRFVAVVQVAGRDFLIAGSPSNIALLAQLDPKVPFEEVLHRTMTVPSLQPEKPKRKTRKKAKVKLAADQQNGTVTEQKPLPRNSPGLPQQKAVKPIPKPVSKPKQVATEPESALVMPPFNIPESVRLALQNADANTSAKSTQQNGRAEPEHAGHWA